MAKIKKAVTNLICGALFIWALFTGIEVFDSTTKNPILTCGILALLVYSGYLLHVQVKNFFNKMIGNIFLLDKHSDAIPSWATKFKDVNLNIGVALCWAALGISHLTIFFMTDLTKLQREPVALLADLAVLFIVIAFLPPIAFVFKYGIDDMMKN